jgi:hypothetical protein
MQPGNPLEDSRLGGIQGKGQVDMKRFKEVADVWGKLPEKERAKAMVDLKIEPYLKISLNAAKS